MYQLLRKRHIGNDIVTIIFQEPGALPFTPKNIRSHFQHVFIIVRAHNPCTDNVCYRYAPPRMAPGSHPGDPPPPPTHTQEIPKAVCGIQAACGFRPQADSWPRWAASRASCLCFSRGALSPHPIPSKRVILNQKGTVPQF